MNTSSNAKFVIDQNTTEEEKLILSQIIKSITEVRKRTRTEKMIGLSFLITGGWVRDKLLNIESSDIDIVVKPHFYNMFIEELFRQLSAHPHFRISNTRNFDISTPIKKSFEITKIEIEYKKDKIFEIDVVKLVKGNIADDAMSRDFTINSIYLDLEDSVIHDPLYGLTSLEKKKIYTCECNFECFKDVNRVIRIFRISAKIGFSIPKRIKNYIKNEFGKENLLMLKTSKLEFGRLCKSPHTDIIVRNLKKCDILNYFPFDIINTADNKIFKYYEQRVSKLTTYLEKNIELLDKLKVKKLDKPTILMLYWCFIYLTSAYSPDYYLKDSRSELFSKEISRVIDHKQKGFFKMILIKMLTFSSDMELKGKVSISTLNEIPEKIRMIMVDDPYFHTAEKDIISTLEFCNLKEFTEIKSTAIPDETKKSEIDLSDKNDVRRNLEDEFMKSEKSENEEENSLLKSIFVENINMNDDIEFDSQSQLSVAKSSPVRIGEKDKEPESEPKSKKSNHIELFALSEKNISPNNVKSKSKNKNILVEDEYEELDLLGLNIENSFDGSKGETTYNLIDNTTDDITQILDIVDLPPIILNSVASLQTSNLDTSFGNLLVIPSKKTMKKKSRKDLKLRQRIGEQKMLISHLKGKVKRLEKKQRIEKVVVTNSEDFKKVYFVLVLSFLFAIFGAYGTFFGR